MRNSLDPLAWLDCTTTQRESSTGKVTAPTAGQRVNLCGTPPKCVLHVLNRPGVSVTWERGELHFHVAPEALTKAELTLLLGHKEEVGGWLLLHKLWEAGYSLRLQPSEYGPGYVLIPTNPPTPRRTGARGVVVTGSRGVVVTGGKGVVVTGGRGVTSQPSLPSTTLSTTPRLPCYWTPAGYSRLIL